MSGFEQNQKFIGALTSGALEALDEVATLREYPRGSYLFREQQVPRYVFIIDEGRVKLFTTSSHGRAVIIRIAARGDVLGLSAAMTGSTYDVSAEAIENCRIKAIRVNEFMQLLQKYPEASMAATQSALSKYQQAFEEIRRLTLPHTVAGRIARLLLEWENFYRKKAPAEDRLIVAVTREELAELTGTSRETVSRTLHEFRRKNLISIKGSSIQILNRQELEEIAS